MAFKAVEMVRRIRNRHFEQTKGLTPQQQIRFIKKKAERLQRSLKDRERTCAPRHVPASKS